MSLARQIRRWWFSVFHEDHIFLFLDIDGVLATGQDRRQHLFKTFSPGPAAEFRRIVEEIPNLRIVLSSSWRKLRCRRHALRKVFCRFSIPWDRVVGRTPSSWHGLRGLEIADYLAERGIPIAKAVVLDDERTGMDCIPQEQMFKVTFHEGLTREAADRIISYIKGLTANAQNEHGS